MSNTQIKTQEKLAKDLTDGDVVLLDDTRYRVYINRLNSWFIDITLTNLDGGWNKNYGGYNDKKYQVITD